MNITVPDAWMPAATMKRVIVHWTVGNYRANSVDRAAYHLLIEGDGKLIRGTHSIADNVNTADGDYAAHVRLFNRYSIGVSMCCMVGCKENPFKPGNAPMKKEQWEAMIQVVAQLCRRYDIDVTPQTVLGHGEVEKNCGVDQLGKWDPMVLPFDTSLSRDAVGKKLLDEVREALEPPVRVTVVLLGETFAEDDAQMDDGRTFIALRETEEKLGWTITQLSATEATVTISEGRTVEVPFMVRGGRGWVSSAELAEALGASASWDPVTRTVTIG